MKKLKFKIIRFLVGKEKMVFNTDINSISQNIYDCNFVNSCIKIKLNNVQDCNITNNNFTEESELHIYSKGKYRKVL